MCATGQQEKGGCSSLQQRGVDKTQKMMLGLAKYLLRLPGSDKLPV